MKDIMIDIETMGVKSNAAIIEIAAVPFNIETGETSDNIFHEYIDLQSSIDSGMTCCASTIQFWSTQKRVLDGIEKPMEESVTDFEIYMLELDNDINVWSNSPSFDLVILKSAFDIIKRPYPWKFWNERDLRTYRAMNNETNIEHVRTTERHNALLDCLDQIEIIRKTQTYKTAYYRALGMCTKLENKNRGLKSYITRLKNKK